jgi:hypothetical protein
MHSKCTSILPNPVAPAKPAFPPGSAQAKLPAMLSLKEVIERYNALAEGSRGPVALSAFNLSNEETVRLFAALNEDYHISRFLHFSLGSGQSYLVDGESVSHIALDPAISSLL